MAGPDSAAQGIFLLLGGAVLMGHVAHRLFRRYHVSDVLLLLLTGVLLGPLLGLVDGAPLRDAFAILGPLGLMVVLFEGGLELRWRDFQRHAGRAVGLGLLAWALSAIAIGLVAHLLLGYAPALAALFGVATCATGILVVIPLLKELRAPPEARVMLTLESSLGDLLSAVATAALAGALLVGTSPVVGAQVLVAKFVVGAATGFLAGVAWGRVLTHLKGQAHGYVLTLGALLVVYTLTERIGGSGYLAALAFGLVVGNADALLRHGGVSGLSTLDEGMRAYQGEFIFFIRSVYFLYLGLAVSPAVFTWPHVAAGAALAGALLAARVLAVRAAAGPALRGDPLNRHLLTWVMPRGLATALIAGIPIAMGVPGTGGFLDHAFVLIVATDLATGVGVHAYGRLRAAPAPARAPGGAAPAAAGPKR